MDQNNITIQAVQAGSICINSRLPTIVMILGIVEALYFLFMLVFYYLFEIPQLTEFYHDSVVSIPNPYIWLLPQALFLIFPVAEAYYGFWLRKLQKTKNELPIKHKKIIYGIFIVTILLVIFQLLESLISMFTPIISLKSALH